jgi:hypothetical protein
MRLILTPKHLREPTVYVVQRTARYNGMDDLAEDDINFVLDLIAHYCGGKRPPSVLMEKDMERLDFIERFPLEKVPRNNPITKAVHVLKLLRLAEAYTCYMNVVDLVAWLITKISKQLDDVDLSRLLLLTGDNATGEEKRQSQQLAAEIEVQGVDVKELLRIAQQLEQTAEFQSPHAELVPDPDGEDVYVRPIRGK